MGAAEIAVLVSTLMREGLELLAFLERGEEPTPEALDAVIERSQAATDRARQIREELARRRARAS